MIVYLIHLEPAFGHAGHYCGYTELESAAERLDRHAAGRGAVMLRHAVAAGTRLVLARVWDPAPRQFERRLKGRGLRPVCPICDPNALGRYAHA